MIRILRSIPASLLLLALASPLLAQQSSSGIIPQLTRLDEAVANVNLNGFVDEAV